MSVPIDLDAETRTIPDGPIDYVCVTCRTEQDTDEGPRAGQKFAEAVAEAAQGSGVTIAKVECLANCRRSLSAAMRKKNGWTYIFGNLTGPDDAPALIEGARLFGRGRRRQAALARQTASFEGRHGRPCTPAFTWTYPGGL